MKAKLINEKEESNKKVYGKDSFFTHLMDKIWDEGAARDFSSKEEMADFLSRQDDDEIINYLEGLIRDKARLMFTKPNYPNKG